MAAKAASTKEHKPVKPPETLFQLLILMVKNVFTKGFVFNLILSMLIGLAVTYIHTYIVVKIYGTIARNRSSVIYDNIIYFGKPNVWAPGAMVYDKPFEGGVRTFLDVKTFLWALWNGISEVFRFASLNVYLFWTLSSGIVVGSISRMISFGPVKFFIDIFKHFKSLFSNIAAKPGSRVSSRFLGGFIIAIVLGMFVFNPMISLMLSINLFLAMSSGENSFILLLTKLTKSDLRRLFRFKKPFVFDGEVEAARYNGMVFGFIVVGLIPIVINRGTNIILGIILAIFTVIAFFNLGKRKDAESLAMFLFILLGYLFIPVMKVFADDGGWAESGGTVNGWLHNPGTPYAIKNGIPPGIYSGLAGIFGSSLPSMIKKYGGWKNLVDSLSQGQKDYIKNTINDQVAQAQKDAADANSYWGLTKQTVINAKDEIVQTAGEIGGAVKDTVGYIWNNPAQALSNSWNWTKDNAVAVGNTLVDCGKGIYQAGKDIWNDPSLIGATIYNSGVSIKDAVVTTVTDPKKAWEFIKENTGINNFINSWDPNRPLIDRIFQVGVGVVKVWGTIETVGAAASIVKAGGSKLIGAAEGLLGSAGGKTVGGAATKGLAGAGGRAIGRTATEGLAGAGGKAAGRTATEGLAGAGGKAAGRTAAEGAGSKLAGEAGGGGIGTVKGTPKGTTSVVGADGKAVTTNGFTSTPKPANPGGLTRDAVKQAQIVADNHGVNIHIRQTNPYSKPWIDSGRGLPKPEYIKTNTVNPYDTLIGAPKNSEGLVAHFKPTPPVKGNMPDDVYKQLYNRYEKRLADFKKYDDTLQQMASGPNPKINIRDGIVYDTKTGKPFAGDYDIAGITGKNGEALPKAVKDQIVKELKNGPFGAQHDPLANWPEKLTPEYYSQHGKTMEQLQQDISSYIRQINDHKAGGEGLIQVSAGGKNALNTSYINVVK